MTFKLIIIYGPPYSSTHPVSTETIFNELIEYLESVILQYAYILFWLLVISMYIIWEPFEWWCLKISWSSGVSWSGATCPWSNPYAWPYVGPCYHKNWWLHYTGVPETWFLHFWPHFDHKQNLEVSLDKITVGENSIPPAQIVKNLGTLMDCNLKLRKQILTQHITSDTCIWMLVTTNFW